MNYLMLSCKKAASLIDKKAEVKLTFNEGMQLHVHKSMCAACTAYEKQSLLIDKALRQQTGLGLKSPDPIIGNKNLQQRIIGKL